MHSQLLSKLAVPRDRITMHTLPDMKVTLTRTNEIRTMLIAPCGMNCCLCRAYRREKKACPGCRRDNSVKPKTRVVCRIKTCEKMRRGNARNCSSCEGFPCDTLRHLDERYRTKYGMSMIDNLVHIRKFGIRHFIKSEKDKWTCPECGQLLSVHRPLCLSCGHKWR